MKNSNTSRSARLFAVGLAALSISPTGFAVDPNRGVSQYIRDRWGPEKGFPSGPVYAIAQDAGGYLFVGTEAGLARFDGFSFQLIRNARPSLSDLDQPLNEVLGLTSDGAGNLWVRARGPNLLRYRDGAFFDVPPDLDEAHGGTTVASRGGDGEMIVATNRTGLFDVQGGKLQKLIPWESMPVSPVISLARTSGGAIWMGTRDDGLARFERGRIVKIAAGLPDLKINCLLPVANGDLWIGTDRGIVRWDGSKITPDGIPRELQHAQAFAMILDGDGNIWVGAGAEGLFRANSQGISRLFAQPGESVTALFEDRDGDLWTGGSNGLERLRDSAFATYSRAEGMPSDANGPLFAAGDRLWFAPLDGGLFSLRDGAAERVTAGGLDGDVVYSIDGKNGDLWIGRQRGGLTHLHLDGGSYTARTYTTAQGLARDTVVAVHESRDGAVWAGTLNGGVSRLLDGRFTTYNQASSGLASDTVFAILQTADGAMWFATPSGLSELSGGVWRTFTTQDGLPSANIDCLFEDSQGILWVGTLEGLAFLRDGRALVPSPSIPALHEQIDGFAEDAGGALWISTDKHVLRVQRQVLLDKTVRDADVRAYSLADGLRGSGGIKRDRSVMADGRGRIWFSMTRGISVVDPARLKIRAVPPIVHIQGLTADGSPVALGNPVRIPAGRQRISLEYVGLSLAFPERTRFRYTLEGFDHQWSGPVASREAVYTNLGPGKYRFRVVASNSDQVFNSQEADLAFQIEPLIWQTLWFQTGTVLVVGLAIGAFVRSRMNRWTRQMDLRFEERLAERTRIAQELHDTLLQGFLSASMQLHVAADQAPEESPVKSQLQRILALMARVIEEGRGALTDLRVSPGDSLDLERAFSQIPQEVGAPASAAFRVTVEGKRRPLHPVLRDEVYRIGREALVNAFRHANADSVEVELEYAPKFLRVMVRDNGCGIDPVVLESGREGHWGLSGMRERAERIGAQLHVWSRAGSGTEVELSVPSHIAFKGAPRDRPRRGLWGKK